VQVPIKVVPTGIDVKAFASANGAGFREKFGIPARAFVIGHVGRLAPEKNLGYLAEAVGQFLKRTPGAWFLVVGDGPSVEELKTILGKHGVGDRLVLAGKQTGRALHEAYRAMDVFAFASKSETQGMVLAEAMAASLPVVALNASGVREVMHDGENGFMLPSRAAPERFAAELEKLRGSSSLRRAFRRQASATADLFSRERSAALALDFYEEIRRATRRERLETALSPWGTLLQRLGLEWDLLATRTQAVAHAVLGTTEAKAS
jgi:1,2-diacylglycerol 3-alpha-glucosyltransferase